MLVKEGADCQDEVASRTTHLYERFGFTTVVKGAPRLVEAALELLDRDGLAGVTTRRLAQRLGVKSPSLYWHVRDREELLGLLSDRVVADAHWPEPLSGWRATAEGLMREYLRCLLAHRDAARVVAGRPPMGPNRLLGAEMLLRALLSAGLREPEAIDAGLVLTTYVVGFAFERRRPTPRRSAPCRWIRPGIRRWRACRTPSQLPDGPASNKGSG